MTRTSTVVVLSIFSIVFVTQTWAGGHTWRVNEIFSNADGTIQFIEVKEFFGGNGETGTAGHNVTSNTRSFTIPNNAVPPTGFKHILLATPGFVGLPGAPTPDYVFPAGSVPFFATTGDTIRYVPYCSYTFGAGVLPTNGINSLTLTSHEAHAFTIAANSPTNYAGQTGSINVGCPLGTPCGNPSSGECDNPDTCDAGGVCQPNNISGPCTDDGNPCTDDVCAGGACTHPNDDANICDDGLFCTGPDLCIGGACVGGGSPCPPGETCNEAQDRCETVQGACCFLNQDMVSCALTQENICTINLGGVWSGPDSLCPQQNVVVVDEGGGEIFVHVIGPPVDCDNTGMRASRGSCSPTGPFLDAWASPADSSMCHNFGVSGSPAIPADFFNPGSDPFNGPVCLEGADLGNPDFLGADTLIQRSADPFAACDEPSAAQVTVDIELIALSLVSVSPMTVTYNGGQNPENWDMAVGLSVMPAPTGTLTAVKSHCNGGTYTSVLSVQPRFTFTKVGSPSDVRDLDTGMEAILPITLTQANPAPWVNVLDPNLPVSADTCSQFHAGIEEPNPTTQCNYSCRLYGDVVSQYCVIDVDDILHVLNCFVDPQGFPEGDIEPCGGDQDCDVDDITAELTAFTGFYYCQHPCEP